MRISGGTKFSVIIVFLQKNERYDDKKMKEV